MKLTVLDTAVTGKVRQEMSVARHVGRRSAPEMKQVNYRAGKLGLAVLVKQPKVMSSTKFDQPCHY